MKYKLEWVMLFRFLIDTKIQRGPTKILWPTLSPDYPSNFVDETAEVLRLLRDEPATVLQALMEPKAVLLNESLIPKLTATILVKGCLTNTKHSAILTKFAEIAMAEGTQLTEPEMVRYLDIDKVMNVSCG